MEIQIIVVFVPDSRVGQRLLWWIFVLSLPLSRKNMLTGPRTPVSLDRPIHMLHHIYYTTTYDCMNIVKKMNLCSFRSNELLKARIDEPYKCGWISESLALGLQDGKQIKTT